MSTKDGVVRESESGKASRKTKVVWGSCPMQAPSHTSLSTPGQKLRERGVALAFPYWYMTRRLPEGALHPCASLGSTGAAGHLALTAALQGRAAHSASRSAGGGRRVEEMRLARREGEYGIL